MKLMFTYNVLNHQKVEELWEKYAKANSKFSKASDARRTRGIGLIPIDFGLQHSRPLGANIKVIGAISPEPARKLPEYLNKFMSENKVVVVVSFGAVHSNYPDGLAQSIADELSKVKAAVLWKYSGELPKNLGKNIMIIPWFPKNQLSFNDILGHSSTKVFVSHGGLNGFQESVYHAVPMVIIPMSTDQPRQASLVESKKIGVAIQWKRIRSKVDVLKNGIHEVLQNKVYKENILKISTIVKDRKMRPVQEAAEWIEYAIRLILQVKRSIYLSINYTCLMFFSF